MIKTESVRHDSEINDEAADIDAAAQENGEKKEENMNDKRSIVQRIIAVVVAIVTMATLLPVTAVSARADESVVTSGTSVADERSLYTYQDIFDDIREDDSGTTYSTQYSGRIWADKSVNTEPITFEGDLHYPDKDATGSEPIPMNENADFQVAYSLMGNTSTTVTETDAPMDVVLMLDFSPQSNSQTGKVQTMLNAVKGAIDEILAANDGNRVAVIGYSTQAKTLLPLGHYQSVELKYEGNATQESTVTCTYTSENGTDAQNSEPSNTFTIAANGGGMNKYTQQGIYAGMQALIGSNEVKSDGQQRQPVMILLSEGEPKIASTNIMAPTPSAVPLEGLHEQYSAQTAYTQEPGATENKSGVEIIRNYNVKDELAGTDHEPLSDWDNRHAQTFATLLTAAYAKNQVTKHYFGSNGDENSNADKARNEALFYTVGIRTNSANSPNLAQIVLDPSEYLEEGSAAAANNPLSDKFIGYAESYFDGRSVKLIDAGKTEDDPAQAHTTIFDPKVIGSIEGVDSLADLRYNDMFFNATSTNNGEIDFGTIFEDILTNVATDKAQGTTHISEGGTSAKGGYVTYTDPLGDYMEVKSIDALIHSNIIFTNPTKTTSEDYNITTYTFRGVATNPVYGSYSVANIIITVETDEKGRQTLTVKVPAALIPLREATVYLDETGDDTEITSYTQGRTFPMRLVYSVGLKEEVENDDGTINREVVDVTDAIGDSITFYEGQYSGKTEENFQSETTATTNRTVGDAWVSYTPATNNPFYYLAEETPVYMDKTCTEKLAWNTASDDSQMYYFQVPYYEHTENKDGSNLENTIKHETIEREGRLLKEKYAKNVNGYVYLKVGTPRISSLSGYTTLKGADTAAENNNVDKDANQSKTAEIRMFPTYVKYDDEGSSIGDNGEFRLYLGNNGAVTKTLADETTPGEGDDDNNTTDPGDPDDPSTDPEDPEQPPITDPDDPSEPEDPSEEPEQPLDPDGPDDLNTVDHFYYIVGYPEDYRTGEVTDDESLWPIKPQGNITRAEVATIFYRLLNKDVREANTTNVSPYYDVDSDDWFATTVSTLAHMGILSGYEDGSFRPNAPITRAEFAAIAARFFENTDDVAYEKGRFTDIVGNEWYADIVQAAVDLNLIGGYPDGTMRPQNSITRAEACAIVNRTIERRPHDEHLAAISDMRTWPDNLPGAWYYADMQEATNGHDYVWIDEDNQRIEEWTKVRPDFDWTLR